MYADRPTFLGGASLEERNGGGKLYEQQLPTTSTSSMKKRFTRARRKTTTRRKEPSLHLGSLVTLLSHFEESVHGEYAVVADYCNRLYDTVVETLKEQLDEPDFFEELCRRMLIILRSEWEGVRAVAFRILRLSAFQQRNLLFMLTNHVDMYAIRALDLRDGNDLEREAAFQLLCRMMKIYDESPQLKSLVAAARSDTTANTQYAFPKSIMQPVISIALKEMHRKEDSKEERDNLALPCVALFLELAVSERVLVLEMAGTDWIVCALIGTASVSTGIATLVSRVLVAWLDDPVMRQKANLNLVLEQIFAPLIEYGFFQTSNIEGDDCQPLELPLDKYSSAFLAILRSWPGLLSCAAVGPNGMVTNSSPLKLLEYLGLGALVNKNLLKIRDMVVDICCEFVDRPYASCKFTSWEQTLDFYSQMDMPDAFSCSLRDDFVIVQGEEMQYTTTGASEYMDMLASFRGMATFILISAGLPQSLSRLIVAHPDDPSALKATLLLSDLCRLSASFLPSEWKSTVLSLPTLVQSACETISRNNGALAVNDLYKGDNEYTETSSLNEGNAMLVLFRLDELTRRRLLSNCEGIPPDSNYALFVNSDKQTSSKIVYTCDPSNLSSTFSDAIGNSAEPVWISALSALSTTRKQLMKGEKTFRYGDKLLTLVEKIFLHLLPSRGVPSSDRLQSLVGKTAVQCSLALANDEHYSDLLQRFAEECYAQLAPNRLASSPFSVKHLVNHGSSIYFCMLGTMSSHERGIAILTKSGVMQMFLDLMTDQTPTEYVKLIVSCLDYGIEGSKARLILQKALTSTNENGRKWSTRFLTLLAPLPIQFHQWGVRLMVAQLGDPSAKVVRHAVRLLHQWAPKFPTCLLSLRPFLLDSFGDAGVLLRSLIYGNENICRKDLRGAKASLALWMKSFNIRYVELIEEEMRIALLGVRRTQTGDFARPSQDKFERFGVRARGHLLGELARHEVGRELLIENVVIDCLVEGLRSIDCEVAKASAMALAHIGREAMHLLPSESLPLLCRLAEESEVLSLRGIAFWAMCIIGANEAGARAISLLGWESTRHTYVLNETKDTEGSRHVTRSRIPTVNLVHELPIDISLYLDSPLPTASLRSRSHSVTTLPRRQTLQRRDSAPSVYPEIKITEEVFESEFDGGLSSPRCDRSITVESAFTSGLGSVSEEGRRRTTSVGEEESRSRSSTLQTCFSGGNAPRNRLEYELGNLVSESSREEHFSSRNRQRWRLYPLKIRKYIQLYKNVGDPVRYVYMTKEELTSLSEFRSAYYHDDWLSKELKSRSEAPPTFSHPLPYLTLPCEVYLVCRNIFSPSRSDHSSGCDSTFGGRSGVEDRGTKSGHGRVRTDQVKGHNKHGCFYCSLPEHQKIPFEMPVSPEESGSLRFQVLQLIDLLEIKHAMPEKKLLSLRARHPWLFDWPCLYADVLEMLDQYRFKDRSRTFLQEIFYNALKL